MRLGLVLLIVFAPLLARAAPAAGAGGDYQPFVPAQPAGPSAPMFVVIAYAAIWIVLLLFVASVWWRQRRVDEELRSLRGRLEGPST